MEEDNPVSLGQTFNARAGHAKFKDLAEMRAFCRKLIELWDRDQMTAFTFKGEYSVSAPLIWSYTHHVVQLMRTVVELSAHDRLIIAIPLVRLMVENTITGIWLLLEPNATRAVVHEGLRQRRAAVETVLELGASGFSNLTLSDVEAQLTAFSGGAMPAGKAFEQRCRNIVDGLGVYASWRIMSSYSHAGMAMGDFYLTETIPDEENALGLELNPHATLDHHEAWLGTALCMMIAALTLCDQVETKSQRKQQVSRAAKRIGITLDFALV